MKFTNLVSPLWIYFAPDDGAGDGSDADEEQSSIRETGFNKRLKNEYGDNALDFAMALWEQTFKLRQAVRSLKSQAEQGKLPDGAIILTKDQADLLQSYQALGTPEQVKTKLDERDQIASEMDTLKRESVLQRAATVTGYDYDVLKEMDTLANKVGGKSLVYEVRETETDGVKALTAFVKDGQEEKPLADYAQTNWAKHMPSLVIQSNGGGTPQPTGQPSGVFIPMMGQERGGGHQAKTPKDQTLATLNSQYPKRTRQDK